MMQTSETRVVSPDPRQALNAVRTLRRTLARLGLPNRVSSEAGVPLEQIGDELQMPEPDRGVVTGDSGVARDEPLLSSAGWRIEAARSSSARSGWRLSPMPCSR
jgi:hypothetical protein